jgi:two-component system, sporulation sensor kinase E
VFSIVINLVDIKNIMVCVNKFGEADLINMRTNNTTTVSPENILFNLYNQLIDGIVVFNCEGIIIEVNQAFCGYLGIVKEQILGYPLDHFVPEEMHYKLKRQQVMLSENGNARGVLPLKHSLGLSYFDIVTTHDSGHGNFISVFRDITDNVLLKQQSQQYSHFFEELFIEALDGIVIWDRTGKILNANYAATFIFECQYHDLIGSKMDKFIIEQNIEYQRIVKQIIETGSARGELNVELPSGKRKLIEFTSRLHSVDGYHMTIFRDVSQRYKMEQELRESEQKFRSVFEGSLEGLLLWNETSGIVDINQAACQLFGLPKSCLIGRSLLELIPDIKDNKKNLEELISVLSGKRKRDGSFALYIDEETVRTFEFSTIFHIYSDIHFIVLKEVTDKIEMEKRLKKSDTLNVVGELAAGIAHEIRNPMTALKGFIQLLHGEFKDERSMYFQVIQSELNRIDSIINEFLILAKPQAVKYSKVDLTKIMQETIDLLSAQALMYNVQFQTYYEETLTSIYCEPNQLKKVFVNMIKNAIEVMQNGGQIKIKLEKINSKSIHISIQDEGIGIPAEKIKKLGEPFYTTKERGTGLGLMVSYKIIEEHNGIINVKSQEGVGTTFHIYLPT